MGMSQKWRREPPGALRPASPATLQPSDASLSVFRRVWALAVTQWALLFGQFALLAVGFAWPLEPTLSLGVLFLLSALTLPWAWLVLAGVTRAPSEPHGAKAWVFRLGLIGMVATFLGAKWWLRLADGAGDPDALIGTWRSYGIALVLLLPLGLLGTELRFSRVLALVQDHPARLMASSFGAAGVFGGLLLSLPPAMQRVQELSLVDNLFMAFSAVCVTGLSVNTLSQTYTLFGQVVLCLLIQIGGLGIMVLSVAIGLLAGQRLRVKSSAVLAEIVDTESLAGLRRVVLAIVGATFLIEGVGALLLYSRFLRYSELLAESAWPSGGEARPGWVAVFHAVSAFCNAGFSNLHDGLVPFVGDPAVMAIMVTLVVSGGIGFPVISELGRRVLLGLRRRRPERLSLHTRVCLQATLTLFVGVALMYLALDWNGAFSVLSWSEKISGALFHSASSRTAGFNLVEVEALHPASLMLTCVAMFIGACPGSCGGGIKTTTFAALFAGLRSELQGRPAYLMDRGLSPATIRKAVGVSFLSIGLVSSMLFLLLLSESHAPFALAFEAFSAFSTTGLSMGITPHLSTPGKILVLLLMYMGRIGPLTLALALSRRIRPVPVTLPDERMLIG